MILTLIAVKLLREVSVRPSDVISFLVFVGPAAIIDIMFFVVSAKLFINFMGL